MLVGGFSEHLRIETEVAYGSVTSRQGSLQYLMHLDWYAPNKKEKIMLLGKVIDGDGHILEPPQLWHQYLEAKYKDRAIRLEKDQAGVEYLVIDGRPSARLRGLGPAVASLPAGIQQKILGDNAAEAYQLS